MSPPRLRQPGQPAIVRLCLGVIELLASLRLAVVLLTFLIVVLAIATFIQTSFGAPAARFAVYRSWWFSLLGGLLGLNVFCAAAVRLPWKRHQAGFVMTHAGILILLAGALITARHGIDAQLSVYEGRIGHLAFEDTVHLDIEMRGDGSGGDAGSGGPKHSGGTRQVRIPLRCGPFNWRDYSRSLRHLLWAPPGKRPIVPWQLAYRDQGVVFDEGGFGVEVLDYYADSRRVQGGYLVGYAKVVGTLGNHSRWFQSWQSIELELRRRRYPGDEGTAIVGSRTTLTDGTRVTLLCAENQAELDGFLLSQPEGVPDEEGQIVLVHNRKRYVILVKSLAGKSQVDFALGDSGLRVVEFQSEPRLRAVQLKLSDKAGNQDDLILFADVPEFNKQSQKFSVAGAYWVDFKKLMSQPESMSALVPDTTAGGERLRIDLCQGPDQKLYYRLWLAPNLLAKGEVPLNNGPTMLFDQAGIKFSFVVYTFAPCNLQSLGDEAVVPVPFRRGTRMTEPRLRVRLIADGKSEEAWLAVLAKGTRLPVALEEMAFLKNGAKEILVSAGHDTVDIGLRLRLVEFQRKLEPGTNQPSHYASLVDILVPASLADPVGSRANQPDSAGHAAGLASDDENSGGVALDGEAVDPEDGERLRVVQRRVLITLNHPINIVDPRTGRTYRLYQESFSGPFKPGDPVYEQIVGGDSGPDELYASTLSVNYDPGRGLKYFGSLLIVCGIIVMYLMRAYMFRPRSGEKTEGLGTRGDSVAGESESPDSAAQKSAE